MNRIPLSRLPKVALVAIGLVFFDTYALVMEYVVQPSGLAAHLPLYRVESFCTWDLAVILIIAGSLWWAGKDRGRTIGESPGDS
jgi:hypothetical protein